MPKLKANITPKVLEWARLSAGYSPDEAAAKVSKNTTAEAILAWEKGDDQPSVSQMRRLAEAYKRPLSLFYLPNPPKDFQPMHDFRRMPGEVANHYSPLLRREMRWAGQRRELALELYQDIEQEPPRFSVGRASLSDGVEQLGSSIREGLSVTYLQQTWAANRRNSFMYWRRKIDEAGVLIFQAERVPTDEMLGFSVAASILPVIVVNRKNRRGRVFTLLHEFVHLMLRGSAICDIDEDYDRPAAEQRTEIFCNAVAASALVPEAEFLQENTVTATRKDDWQMGGLDALAEKYGVSAMVILRRLLTLRRISERFYRERQADYHAIYARLDKQAQEQTEEAEILRNMPQETIGKLGANFIRLVLDNYYRERITLSDVSDYLGVKVRHVQKIEEKVRAG